MGFRSRGTHITIGIGPEKPVLEVTIKYVCMCFSSTGTHITRDRCFPGRRTHITRDTCFPCGGQHVTRDMCFPGRGTHITGDTCFPGGGTQISFLCRKVYYNNVSCFYYF